MQQETPDEMHIVLLTGRRLQFMPHELHGFYASRSLLITLGVILVLLVAADPFVFPSPVSLPGKALFWAMAIGAYFVAMFAVGAVTRIVMRWLNLTWVYLPLVDIPIIVIATILGAYAGGPFLPEGQTRLGLDFLTFTRNFLLAQGLEFGLVNWGLSEYLRKSRAKAKIADHPSMSEPSPERPSISANGRMIFLDQLIEIESKQQYVDIKTRAGTLTVRSTLKALTGQLRESDGLQIHRNCWVSAGMIVGISGGRTKRVVHLRDGSTLPVSRPRGTDVEKWFNLYGGSSSA